MFALFFHRIIILDCLCSLPDPDRFYQSINALFFTFCLWDLSSPFLLSFFSFYTWLSPTHESAFESFATHNNHSIIIQTKELYFCIGRLFNNLNSTFYYILHECCCKSLYVSQSSEICWLWLIWMDIHTLNKFKSPEP